MSTPNPNTNNTGNNAGGVQLQGHGHAQKLSGAGLLYDPARPLPGDSSMEQCVLSCMMQAPEYAVPAAVQRLQSADFCVEAHRMLFDLVSREHDAGRPVDPVSLTSLLYDRGLIAALGGPGLIGDVFTASPNPAHVKFYAERVHVLSKRRQLIFAASDLMTAAFDGHDEWRDEASAHLRRAELTLTAGAESQLKSLSDVCAEYAAYYDAAGSADPAVSSGLRGLDAILSGGIRREYIIIGAPSGHGKSLLAMQLAGRLAASGRAGLIAGYEMTSLEVVMRDLARETGVPLDVVMGRTPPAAGMMQSVTRKISEWCRHRRVAMLDDPAMTPEAVAAHARHLHRRGALDFMVVDYLQLVPLARAKGERRDEVLGELSAFFAALRKELNCTIIAPVQLNDEGLVRDSRAIVHPAQVFIRIEMEEDENPETGEMETGDRGRLRVLKNRFGQTNRTCAVLREGKFQTFVEGAGE